MKMELKRDAFTDWITKWFKCNYCLAEENAYTKQNHDFPSKVKIIAPIPDSPFEEYFPLEYGRQSLFKNDYVVKAYQPKKSEGIEWPPHLSLARLDLKNEHEIINFTSNYGLLGLRSIPSWQNQEPSWAESKIISIAPNITRSEWYDLKVPNAKPHNWHPNKAYCEPLELFQKATEEYQKAIGKLIKIRSNSEDEKEKLSLDFDGISINYLKGVTVRPVYERGKWILGWQSRSLLEACYFRSVLNLTEGAYGYKHCKREKCNKPFLAQNENDFYCSQRCRKADTVANTAIRVIKGEIKEQLKKGEINKNQWKTTVIEAEKLYKGGIKDLDTLREAVNKILKQ
jgi:hypothetical protein